VSSPRRGCFEGVFLSDDSSMYPAWTARTRARRGRGLTVELGDVIDARAPETKNRRSFPRRERDGRRARALSSNQSPQVLEFTPHDDDDR